MFDFKTNTASIDSFEKRVPGIFEKAFRLRERHVFMSHSVEILKDFSTLTLK